MKARLLIIFLLLSLSFLSSSGQENNVVTRDFELWTNAGITKKAGKWKFSLAGETRFQQNASKFDMFFANLGVEYKINKYIELGGAYRFYKNKNGKEIFETEHRISGDLKLNYEIKRFDLSYRIRLQNRDEDFYKSESSDNNIYNFRNKLEVEYDIKKSKFKPSFSTELFRRLGNDPQAYFNKLRFTLGTSYSIKHIGKFDIFYRYDKDLNVSIPSSTYILGIGYNYKF